MQVLHAGHWMADVEFLLILNITCSCNRGQIFFSQWQYEQFPVRSSHLSHPLLVKAMDNLLICCFLWQWTFGTMRCVRSEVKTCPHRRLAIEKSPFPQAICPLYYHNIFCKIFLYALKLQRKAKVGVEYLNVFNVKFRCVGVHFIEWSWQNNDIRFSSFTIDFTYLNNRIVWWIWALTVVHEFYSRPFTCKLLGRPTALNVFMFQY